jgi:LytR cell envelope-related transcriptional attenuator
VSGPVARQQDEQREGIVLDDGTWVDVGRDGRWRPSPGERTRAAVILGVFIGLLTMVALLLSVGGDRDADEGQVAADDTTTTAEEPVITTTTTLPPDPSSVGGEPASINCIGDDRGGAELRDRDTTAVLVLNATSRTGHAADVVEYLEHLGWATTVPGNGGRLRTSNFAYVSGYCAEAELVAIELGLREATFEPADPDALPVPLGRARIVVTVGSDSL